MKITSSTHLEFPGLQFAIRHGEVKDVPDDPEAAAFILASTSIQEVSEPESKRLSGNQCLINQSLRSL
jgi:hypothetical protein